MRLCIATIMLWILGTHTVSAQNTLALRQYKSTDPAQLVLPPNTTMNTLSDDASRQSGIDIAVVLSCAAQSDCVHTWELSGTFTSLEATQAAVVQAVKSSDQKPPHAIRLNSDGGHTGGAMWLAKYVQNNKINVTVGDTDTCLSACVYVLTAGHKRRIDPWALVGVHQHNASRPRFGKCVQPITDASSPLLPVAGPQCLFDGPTSVQHMDEASDHIQQSAAQWLRLMMLNDVHPALLFYALSTNHQFSERASTMRVLNQTCAQALNLDNTKAKTPDLNTVVAQCD